VNNADKVSRISRGIQIFYLFCLLSLLFIKYEEIQENNDVTLFVLRALLSNTENRISIDSIFGPGVTTEHSAIDLYGNGVRAYAVRLPLNLSGRRTA